MTKNTLDRCACRQAAEVEQAYAVVGAHAFVVGRVINVKVTEPPCFFRLLSWIRAKPRAMTAAQPSSRGASAACSATAPLAVVVIADHDPFESLRAIVTRDVRKLLTGIASENVQSRSWLPGIRVVDSEEGGLAKPLPGDRDSGARARLERYGQSSSCRWLLPELAARREILAVPRGPRLHELDAFACGVHRQLDGAAILRRPQHQNGLPGENPAGSTSTAGSGGSSRKGWPSAPVNASVSGLNDSRPASARAMTIFRTSDKIHGPLLTIISHGKVPGVRGDDRIRESDGVRGPLPLADTRTASVTQNGPADGFEGCHLAIARDGGADLFRTGCDHQRHGRMQAVGTPLSGDIRRSSHVFIR